MTNQTIQPETGTLAIQGQPVDLLVLRGLTFDAKRPFYDFVLTYLVASAGLTPVYDATHYPHFLDGVVGIFPGTTDVHAGADLSKCVALARSGSLPQRQAEVSLCCMLANAAFESIPQDTRDRLKGNPVFEVLRHTRNAASHGNRWHFRGPEPTSRAQWKSITIDQSLKGKANPLYGQACFYGTIQPADLLYLLQDVEKLL